MSIENLKSKYSKYIQQNGEFYIPVEEMIVFVDVCNKEDLLIGGYEILGLWDKATQDEGLRYSTECTDENDWKKSKKECNEMAITSMKFFIKKLGNIFFRRIKFGAGKYRGHVFFPSIWEKEEWLKKAKKG